MATPPCGVWASHCSGFSSCGAQAPHTWASVAAAHRFYSAGSVVVVYGFSCSMACGIFPDQRSNPSAPYSWAGGFLSTALPENTPPPHSEFIWENSLRRRSRKFHLRPACLYQCSSVEEGLWFCSSFSLECFASLNHGHLHHSGLNSTLISSERPSLIPPI